MATFLPDKLNMLEYKPSMVGIPTQSVARLYDRLDKQSYAADAQGTKIKIALAAQIADAAPKDAPYLQDMYNNVEGLIDQAKEEKNLPGYANQIRNMVGDMYADQTFAAIQSTSKKKAKYETDRANMVMQFGEENIIDTGDNPENFSSIHPETGELQQFMGTVTKRPDYNTAMTKLFHAKADHMSSDEALQEFVNGGGEEGWKAYRAYRETPEGRVHQNDIANQMFGVPFIRLNTTNEDGTTNFDRQIAVVQALNEKLLNAGRLKLASGQLGSGSEFTKTGRLSKEWKASLDTSGISGTSLTDGGPGEDQVITIIDDQIKDSTWDQSLAMKFTSDNEFTVIDVGKSFGGNSKDIQPGQKIDPTNIQEVKMTTALSPSGNPIVQLTVGREAKQKRGRDFNPFGLLGEQTMEPKQTSIAYVEMTMDDIDDLRANSEGMMHMINRSGGTIKESGLSIAATLYAKELGPFIMDKEQEDVSFGEEVLKGGLKIQRDDGYYYAFHSDSTPVTNANGAQYRFSSPGDLRAFVGRSVMQTYGFN